MMTRWPPTARDILVDAARFYHREMTDQWPVPEVAMERAIEYAERELYSHSNILYAEAGSRWINRWESGQLEAEMKRAIGKMYQRMRLAEKVIAPKRRR